MAPVVGLLKFDTHPTLIFTYFNIQINYLGLTHFYFLMSNNLTTTLYLGSWVLT